VRHDWDMSNYPFDQQVLAIIQEESARDISEVRYRADQEESGYDDGLELDGWRVADFYICERDAEYDTTFGDPEAAAGSAYTRLFMLVEIERESVTGFFKLTIGAYAALAITLLSFLIPSGQPSLFSARMALLVGSLFAAILSMQVSDEALGSLDAVPLVDEVHILAILYTFAAGLMATISRKNFEHGGKVLAHRWDIVGFYTFGVSFVALNALLIALAVAAG
jgi:hypothetical protein